ncbi:MAG: hypothetical protein FJ387_18125 [Verrucomicrobia bacterium]|nr:hypothetical protein [Verrucomicrobiota bacterium]
MSHPTPPTESSRTQPGPSPQADRPTSGPAVPTPAQGGQPETDPEPRALRVTLWVAAAFCAIVFAGLVVQYFRAQVADPLKSTQIAALKAQLTAQPKNEQVKQQIRELDLTLRQRYFRHLSFSATGACLLLGGGVVCVLAGRRVARLRARPHLPKRAIDETERYTAARQWARWSVAATALASAVAFLTLALTTGSALPTRPAELDQLLKKLSGADDAEGAAEVTFAEYLTQWPRFLGPTGGSFLPNAVLPTAWDVATGAGIAWKTPVPVAGFNSPIRWGNRLFLSGGDAARRAVVCFDAAHGDILWQRPVENVPGSPAVPPEIPEGTGFAASSMATDGHRVYVVFANGDLAAFRLDGSPAWSKNLGVPKNTYGHATSLITWQNTLIVQYDQGDAEQGRSRLYAFQGDSGRLLWERTRAVGASWTTPAVADPAGQAQIVAVGGDWVIGYGAKDGLERWRVEGVHGELAPSPLFAGGLVLAVSPHDRLLAIRPDGAGDVTQTHLAWTAEENIPDVTSPASNGELVFLLSSGGALSCHDLKTGQKLWEQELNLEANASPTIAGTRLLILGLKGETVVLEVGRTFRELARSSLGEPVLASPALAADRVFVRTDKTLFCLATGAANTPPGPGSQQE